MKLHYP